MVVVGVLLAIAGASFVAYVITSVRQSREMRKGQPR